MDLNFQDYKACPIDLDGLKRTIVEKLPNGEIVGGMAHHTFIEELSKMISDRGVQPIITDMFIANNRDKYRPGVTVDKRRAEEMGEVGYEALIVRRVFVNIDLPSLKSDEIDTRCVISFSQRGITVAFGKEVRACRNLSILGAGDVFTTYSIARPSCKTRVFRSPVELLNKTDDYLAQFSENVSKMDGKIERMMNTPFSQLAYEHLLYVLMTARMLHDTTNKAAGVSDAYPLNSSQINACHEKAYFMLQDSKQRGGDLTYWGALNMFNSLFKPDLMSLPSIIPQSLALTEAIHQVMKEVIDV